jgi:hypothetical protein
MTLTHGGEGGAEVQHEHHREERKVRKDGLIDFINFIRLISGAVLKKEPSWTG